MSEGNDGGRRGADEAEGEGERERERKRESARVAGIAAPASRARTACRRRTRIPNRVSRVDPLDHLLGVVPFPGRVRFTCAEGTTESGDRGRRRSKARGAVLMRAGGAWAVASRSHAPAPLDSFSPSADALPPSEVVAVAPAGAQNRRSDPAAPAPDRARSPRNISAAANIVACAARGPLRAIRPASGSTKRRNRQIDVFRPIRRDNRDFVQGHNGLATDKIFVRVQFQRTPSKLNLPN